MGKKKKIRYTLEFKQQAANLANQIGVSKAADQLGVAMSTLHGWQKAAKGEVKPSKDGLDKDEEIRRLRKENEELKKVNYILKKAAAFFSQDHLK